MVDTISMSDFYETINDLLTYVSELDDVTNMIGYIELGDYTSVTDDENCHYLDWAVNRR